MAVALTSTPAAVTVSYRRLPRLSWCRASTHKESGMPDQLPGRRRRLAWTLLGLTVLLLAASVVLGFTGGEAWNQKFATIPVMIAFAAVGALVAARTGNRLGWLFLAAGTAGAVSVAVEAYAARVPADQLPGAAWAGWIFTVVLGMVGTLFFLVPL